MRLEGAFIDLERDIRPLQEYLAMILSFHFLTNNLKRRSETVKDTKKDFC